MTTISRFNDRLLRHIELQARLRLSIRSGVRSLKVWPLVLLIFSPGQLTWAQELRPDTPGKVQIKAIKIIGNSVVKTEELEPILESYAGKQVDLPELKKVAERITQEYRRRGYSLARAYIPEQEVKDGIIEIAVLEGRVGRVIVKGNSNYSTDFITAAFARVIQEGAIRQDSLEKSVLLLNENPDLKAQVILQAGPKAGTTDIVVNVEDKLPLHLVLDYNNFGSKSVSKHRFGAEVSLSRFLPVEGSSLSIRGVMGSDPSDLLYGRTAYVLPINNYGTKLGLSAFGGDFDVGREFAELDIEGKTWGYGIAVSHPLIKTRFQSLTGEFGFESKDADQFLLGELFSRDRIRMLMAGLNYERTDSTGRNLIAINLFQGLGHILGAMENNDPKSSRMGADNQFTRFVLNLARVQRVGEYVWIIFRGLGQVSTRSLVASEQFALGGADSVRGYPQAEFLGDDGYNLSTEIRVAPFANKEALQLAFFADHGATSIKDPPAGTKSYQHLTGIGYGLRLRLPYDFNVRFDVGYPVQPSKTSSGERPALHIQSSVRF